MARPDANAGTADQALLLLPAPGQSNVLTGTTPSAWVEPFGIFNLVLTGTGVGTVAVEMSYDGGTTVVPFPVDALGRGLVLVAPCSVGLRIGESGTLIRLVPNLAGTLAWRISR